MTDLRKIRSIALILISTAVFWSGCKKEQPTPPPPPAPTVSQSLSQTNTAPSEPANPTVVFRFPNLFQDPQPLQQVLDQFQSQHPHIKVQAESLANDGPAVYQNYLQALASKPASADVIMVDVTWLAALAEAGHLRDLSEDWPQPERAGFLPGSLQAAEYLGRIYALPWASDAGVLFYRKDLLQGSAPPRSWGELARVATQFQQKQPEVQGFAWPVTPSEDMVCAVLEFLYSNGGHILNRSKAVANSPENAYALSFAANLITRYKITPSPASNMADPRTLFTQGKALFIREWTSAWPDLDKAFPGQVGIAAIPAFPSKSSTPILRGWQLAVGAGSRQPKSSLLLVKHLCSPPVQKALALAYPFNPVTISIYDHIELTTKRPELAQALPSLRLAGPRPVSPTYPKVSQHLQEAFAKVLRGEATAEAVLAQLQADLMAGQGSAERPNIL